MLLRKVYCFRGFVNLVLQIYFVKGKTWKLNMLDLNSIDLVSCGNLNSIDIVSCGIPHLCLYFFLYEETYLANALAKCLHSPLIGQALQFGLLFVQNTCIKLDVFTSSYPLNNKTSFT